MTSSVTSSKIFFAKYFHVIPDRMQPTIGHSDKYRSSYLNTNAWLRIFHPHFWPFSDEISVFFHYKRNNTPNNASNPLSSAILNMFLKQRQMFDNKISSYTGFFVQFRSKNEIFTYFCPKFGRIFIKKPAKTTFYYLLTVNKHYWSCQDVWNHSVCD